jgi:large subunit ribosomal protein L10
MNRERKAERMAQLGERFRAAKLAVLTDYRGLSAGQLDRLRREIREANGVYAVAKNTLARRAFGERGSEELISLLVGPTAVVFGYQDPVAVAKIVVRFAGDHEALTIKGGLVEGEFLSPARIKELAELPGRGELYARLLAALQAPAARLLRTLNEPAARLVRVLDALRSRRAEGEAGGGAE